MRRIAGEPGQLQIDQAQHHLRRRHGGPEHQRPARGDGGEALRRRPVDPLAVLDHAGGVLQQHGGVHRLASPPASARILLSIGISRVDGSAGGVAAGTCALRVERLCGVRPRTARGAFSAPTARLLLRCAARLLPRDRSHPVGPGRAVQLRAEPHFVRLIGAAVEAAGPHRPSGLIGLCPAAISSSSAHRRGSRPTSHPSRFSKSAFCAGLIAHLRSPARSPSRAAPARRPRCRLSARSRACGRHRSPPACRRCPCRRRAA